MAEAAPRMTYPEYLRREETSEVKHEFVAGAVYAMAGGTVEHGRLAMAVGYELRRQLEGRECVILSSDVRVRIAPTDRSTYPDVTVVCGAVERAADDEEAVTNPTILVEVLSESTERADRGEKWAHYRRLTSLRWYVLVSQTERRLEAYRREGDLWVFHEAGPGARLSHPELDVALDVDALYRDAV